MFENLKAGVAGAPSLEVPMQASSHVTGNSSSESERIVVLDILRGIALLGMFFVHFNYYEATPLGAEPGRMAALVERVIGLFFEERFYGIFGMLFGYAMWGVPLLLVRRWPVWALVVLVVLCAAARPVSSITRIAIASTQPGGIARFNARERDEAAAFKAARDSLQAASQSGSWRTVVAARLAHMPKFHRRWSLLPNGSFTLFLLGLIAWKLRVFTRPAERKRVIIALTMTGIVCWALARFALPFGGPMPPPSPDTLSVSTATTMFARFGFHLFREQWLAFSYIGIVLLLVVRNPAWIRRLAAFAWAGRMALTNYMTQVILVDLLFTPHGLGLKIPALLVFPAAVALFVAQAYFSRWWLSRYSHGPLEWVWRIATNWAWNPLRVARPAMAPSLAA